MDKSTKILSAEHDIIYVNQVEELSLAEWETLTTRATGRAGNMPYAQTIGDMNPAWPTHWVYKRVSLTLFQSYRTENPVLYDQESGEITEQGRRTELVLDGLTGVRRARLRDGRPALAEGAVYPMWNSHLHVIDPFKIPDEWRRFRVVDFGFNNPFVCHWWALGPDGDMYRYREIYMSKRTVRDHAEHIKALSVGEPIETTVCDWDAEGRATLEENGIATEQAIKDVQTGIQAVQARLDVNSGRPGLFYFRNACVETDERMEGMRRPACTEDEYPGYVWAPSQDGKEEKEVPVKKDDHGVDTTKYAVMYVEGETGGTGESYVIEPEDIIDQGETHGW